MKNAKKTFKNEYWKKPFFMNKKHGYLLKF